MAQVIITESLKETILKKFKQDSQEIFDMMGELRQNPKKGKAVGHVGNIVVKELRYGGFRFYFITEGHKVKFLPIEELTDLLIRFVAMSDKKTQQKVIDDIKRVLKNLGSEGFSEQED